MEPDVIHVIGMILLLLATLGVAAVFGQKPLKNLHRLRFAVAIPVGIITFFALPMGMTVHFKSQASSVPACQSLLTSLCLMVVILFVKKKSILIVSCAAILVTGYQLCSQYQYLVTYTGKYAYSDPLSGEYFNFPTQDSWSKGVRVKRLWHTSFTDIYKAE